MIFLQDFDQILQENYLTFFLESFLQDVLYLARKASFLVENLQDMCKIYCKILQVLQEKYLQDLHISCKTVFTGHILNEC